ncbi:hypothetical protein RJ55_00264 [Drechmeria coniospora]|nr:hypothetical protein RJ55_00264 [Drechmeria coniospora]
MPAPPPPPPPPPPPGGECTPLRYQQRQSPEEDRYERSLGPGCRQILVLLRTSAWWSLCRRHAQTEKAKRRCQHRRHIRLVLSLRSRRIWSTSPEASRSCGPEAALGRTSSHSGTRPADTAAWNERPEEIERTSQRKGTSSTDREEAAPPSHLSQAVVDSKASVRGGTIPSPPTAIPGSDSCCSSASASGTCAWLTVGTTASSASAGSAREAVTFACSPIAASSASASPRQRCSLVRCPSGGDSGNRAFVAKLGSSASASSPECGPAAACIGSDLAAAAATGSQSRLVSSGGGRTIIRDSRWQFKDENLMPKPRDFVGGPKKYRAGRGSSVPLDLNAL